MIRNNADVNNDAGMQKAAQDEPCAAVFLLLQLFLSLYHLHESFDQMIHELRLIRIGIMPCPFDPGDRDP
jgi:hypothetical protein